MNVLAQIREEMSPAVATEPPQLQEVQALARPALPHGAPPVLGWLAVLFPAPLARWLPFLLPSLERRQDRHRPRAAGSDMEGDRAALAYR